MQDLPRDYCPRQEALVDVVDNCSPLCKFMVDAFMLDVPHGGIDETVGCQRNCRQFPQLSLQEGDQLVSKGFHHMDWILSSWARDG